MDLLMDAADGCEIQGGSDTIPTDTFGVPFTIGGATEKWGGGS